MTKTSKASVSFVFGTVFLDSLGLGILIPVFPEIMRRFNSDPTFVSEYFGYFISLYSLMQFIASPVLGALADRYGRRPILLLSLFVGGLDYLLMAFAPNLFILFLGRIVSGLTGANQSVASSYMADISDDTNRAANFGMIGAAFGMGFIVGPGIGGLLVNSGTAAPFIAAAVLNLLNCLFGYFILPESLPPEKRRMLELKNLNPFRSLIKIFSPSPILVLVWIFFFYILMGQVHPSVWTLYTEYKFHWTATEVGLSLSYAGAMIALGQGYLTRILIPRLGEFRALTIGLLLVLVDTILFAIVTEGWMVYAVMSIFALSCIAQPAVQSLISKDVPSEEQGELQGTLMALGSFTSIIGPVLYTQLFAHFTTPGNFFFPGAPYVMAALLLLISIALLPFVPHKK